MPTSILSTSSVVSVSLTFSFVTFTIKYRNKKYGQGLSRVLIVCSSSILASAWRIGSPVLRRLRSLSTAGLIFRLTFVGVFGISGLATSRYAQAYTPESPEVRKLVDSALAFLDTQKPHPRLGGKALMAMTLLKGNRSPDHPLIQVAIEACRRAATQLEQNHSPDIIYDLGLSIIFLCELDPDQYRTEIDALMRLLVSWQKEFGGWGYLQGAQLATGDTSMTQYAVLATWTADRTGAFPVNVDSAVNVANWLMRTQDPKGGWAYQGDDPGNFNRIEQIGVQHSLTAAGCGSMYVVADVLRLNRGMGKRRDDNDGLPPALRIVREKSKRPSQGPLTDQLDRALLRRTLADGDGWFARNFSIATTDWTYYYMYGLERYKSFRELAYGEERNPKWYDEGVVYLAQQQTSKGSWNSDNGDNIDTCFGVLFLIRGTQKMIQKAASYDGRLRGGRGLPSDAASATQAADGRIARTPFQGKAESLLSILEAAGDDELNAMEDKEFRVELSQDPALRQRQLERLRRLVTADEFVVRITALKVLQGLRNLDDVPTYIYALSDPDPRVVRRARDALRLMSRKIDGVGLGDDPSQAAKVDAIERWKDWYLQIRPDAQFLN